MAWIASGFNPYFQTDPLPKISIATKAAMCDESIRHKVGGANRGKSPSEEVRNKNRIGQLRAHERDPMLRFRTASRPMLGKRHSDETKEKIRRKALVRQELIRMNKNGGQCN